MAAARRAGRPAAVHPRRRQRHHRRPRLHHPLRRVHTPPLSLRPARAQMARAGPGPSLSHHGLGPNRARPAGPAGSAPASAPVLCACARSRGLVGVCVRARHLRVATHGVRLGRALERCRARLASDPRVRVHAGGRAVCVSFCVWVRSVRLGVGASVWLYVCESVDARVCVCVCVRACVVRVCVCVCG